MFLLLPFHIVVALGSVFCTGYALLSPSGPKLRTSYILLGLTIASGSTMIALKPRLLAQVCEEGLAYTGLMLLGIYAVRFRLASLNNKVIAAEHTPRGRKI